MTLRKKVVEVWRKRVTEEDRDTKAPHRRPEVSQRLCNALPCPQTRSSQRQRTFVFAPVGPIQFNSIRMILEIGDSGTFNTFRDNDDICPLCCWQLILISNLLVADFLSQFLLKIFTHVVTNTHFTYSNITFTMPCYTIWHFFQNIPSNFFPHLAHFNRALHIFTVWISHPREMILVSAKYFCRALSQFCQIILPDAPLTTTRRLDYQLFSLSLYVISDRLLLVWRLQKMQLTKTTQSLRKRAHLRPMTRPSPERGRLLAREGWSHLEQQQLLRLSLRHWNWLLCAANVVASRETVSHQPPMKSWSFVETRRTRWNIFSTTPVWCKKKM